MSDQSIEEVFCPDCGRPIDARQHDEHIACDACGGRFLLRGHFCPACSHYHQEKEAVCAQCGAPLSRVCPECRTEIRQRIQKQKKQERLALILTGSALFLLLIVMIIHSILF